MILYRISKCKYLTGAVALYGIGASIAGGRWNNKGTHLIYTASNASLAMLETLAHTDGKKAPTGLCIVKLKVPGRSVKKIDIKKLPASWSKYPGAANLKRLGDLFVLENKYLLLRVPSAVNPNEYNYLINPLHKDIHLVQEISNKSLKISKRLLKK